MFRTREVLPKVAAAALTIGAIIYGGHELGLDGSSIPSFSEQISRQLGASGIEATGVTVDSARGTFTFFEHEGRYTEICNGHFASEDGLYISDYDPSIDCDAPPGPTILPTQP